MFTLINKLFSLFNKKERNQIYWLLCIIIIMGLVEVAGVVSIMPFMAMVADPEVVVENAYLQKIYSEFGFASQNAFMFFLGVIVLTILTLSNLISAAVTWSILRFTHLCGHSLSERLLRLFE